MSERSLRERFQRSIIKLIERKDYTAYMNVINSVTYDEMNSFQYDFISSLPIIDRFFLRRKDFAFGNPIALVPSKLLITDSGLYWIITEDSPDSRGKGYLLWPDLLALSNDNNIILEKKHRLLFFYAACAFFIIGVCIVLSGNSISDYFLWKLFFFGLGSIWLISAVLSWDILGGEIVFGKDGISIHLSSSKQAAAIYDIILDGCKLYMVFNEKKKLS